MEINFRREQSRWLSGYKNFPPNLGSSGLSSPQVEGARQFSQVVLCFPHMPQGAHMHQIPFCNNMKIFYVQAIFLNFISNPWCPLLPFYAILQMHWAAYGSPNGLFISFPTDCPTSWAFLLEHSTPYYHPNHSPSCCLYAPRLRQNIPPPKLGHP